VNPNLESNYLHRGLLVNYMYVIDLGILTFYGKKVYSFTYCRAVCFQYRFSYSRLNLCDLSEFKYSAAKWEKKCLTSICARIRFNHCDVTLIHRGNIFDSKNSCPFFTWILLNTPPTPVKWTFQFLKLQCKTINV